MKKNKSGESILMMESDQPKSLMEECQEYGIEYFEPSFEFVWHISKYCTLVPAEWYYLSTDLVERPDLAKAIVRYNNWLEAISRDSILAEIKYSGAGRQLRKLERKYNIHRYTSKEREEYIENYHKTKEQELKKAKALVKIAKEEAKQELKNELKLEKTKIV